MKLEYSSLFLSVIVLYAYHMQDTLMHTMWLALLCTSLIHHAGKYKNETLGKVDRTICHINGAVCVYNTLKYIFVFPLQAAIPATINFVILFRMIEDFHVKKKRSDDLYRFIHIGATIVACFTIKFRSLLSFI